ncbi:hypothetical protein [Clostridium sp.]|uniref:hypothetical protein n=1 Tax=Clostridium sp. TaxID=1506 RepID=UPI003D6D4219
MESKFEQLYDIYYDSVYRYIFVIVKSKRNTEDIITTVFIEIFKNKDKIIEVALSEDWIFSLAHDSIMDFYRKSSKVTANKTFLDKRYEDFGYT